MTIGRRSWHIREYYDLDRKSLANLAGINESILSVIEKNCWGDSLPAEYQKHADEINRASKRLKIALDLLDNFDKIIDERILGGE